MSNLNVRIAWSLASRIVQNRQETNDSLGGCQSDVARLLKVTCKGGGLGRIRLKGVGSITSSAFLVFYA